MSTHDNFYQGSRTSISFRPIGYKTRLLFPIIFLFGILLLTLRPGKASHATTVEACVVVGVWGIATCLVMYRSHVEVTVTGLVLTRVMSKAAIKWEDITELHS